jgi:hypothetical protein
VAENEDQPWNDENIEDPWPTQRPQQARQPPVRFGYNQPALFCEAVNTNERATLADDPLSALEPRMVTTTAILVTDAVPFIRQCATHQRRFTPLDK